MIKHSGNPFMVGCAYGKVQPDGKLQVYVVEKSSLRAGSLIVLEQPDSTRTSALIHKVYPSKIVTICRNENLDMENPDALYYKTYKLVFD